MVLVISGALVTFGQWHSLSDFLRFDISRKTRLDVWF